MPDRHSNQSHSYLLNTFYSIISVLLLLTLPASAFAKSPDLLESLKPSHPRLLIEDGFWAELKDRADSDPLLEDLIEQLILEADRLMEAAPLERRKQGRRLLSVSREAFHRISIWSMARHLEDDPRYARRAEQEMLQLVQFKDWNPSHFLDVAEMTAAVAIGYDWLYQDLDASARKTIREGLLKHGVMTGVRAINNDAWWVTRPINWNQVCLGGLTMGALAIADEAPEPAKQILQATRSGISNGLSVYAPDGIYPEGPGYWAYGTVYQCILIDAARSALGSSWKMEETPGFLESANVQVQLAGPTGRFFNFCDGREGPSLQPALFWFAKELNRPELLDQQKELLSESVSQMQANPAKRNRLGILPLLWWTENKSGQSSNALPLSWSGKGDNPVAVFRSSWSDPDAMYLACKGGGADISHAHMDAGSFVFEANGVRWAVDLGMQSYYDLESKGISLWDRGQNGERWSVFRLNNRSHNTLTIDNALHRVEGRAEFTHIDDDSAELDLSSVFKGQAKKVTRKFEVSGHHVTITDQLKGLKPGSKVRWTMATRAKVEISGQRAILRQDGERLEIALDDSSDGQLGVIPADPPDDHFNAANPDTYLLFVDALAPDSGTLSYQLHFRPEDK